MLSKGVKEVRLSSSGTFGIEDPDGEVSCSKICARRKSVVDVGLGLSIVCAWTMKIETTIDSNPAYIHVSRKRGVST